MAHVRNRKKCPLPNVFSCIIPLLAVLLLLAATALAGEIPVGRFSAGDISGWELKKFKGETVYTFVRDNGRTVLKAQSSHGASGLVKKVAIDPRQYPVITWSWKIDHTIKKEDVGSKGGDDFAARVYVVFPSILFWKTRSICYVWSAHMPKGSLRPSAYTGNVAVIAVESGDSRAGAWVTEVRNLGDDYRTFFGEEPPEIGGVGIMTDTDNTGSEATAYYGDILLSGR